MPESPEIGKSSTELERTRALDGGKPAPEDGSATQPLDRAKSEAETTGDSGELADATSFTHVDKMLGEYRLLRKLGRGGMAEVFLAEQTSLKRNVALKILREELVSDETYLKRFKTEAMAAAGLNHPNIV